MSNPFTTISNEKEAKVKEYLRNHKIIEMFEDISTNLCIAQPKQDDIKSFIIDQVKQRTSKGEKYSFYSEAELQNVFALFDLKNEGNITKEQCKKGNHLISVEHTCFF